MSKDMCRSFLSPWKNPEGEYIFEGRFNVGVVTLNVPQIAIEAKGDVNKFWKLFWSRLELCKEALLLRINKLKGTLAAESPIHWMHGGIARLDKDQTIDHLLEGGYCTASLGYIGIYEACKLMTGGSHTGEKGKKFAFEIMTALNSAAASWKEETGYGFSLYGTPSESLCHKLAKHDLEAYGSIEDVTDKGYYTNSYHVDVREEINAFDKLSFEAPFQELSTGGSISYVEIPNMSHNPEALKTMVQYIYNNILYAEFNTKSDNCHVCGFTGEIQLTDDLTWTCPQCGNADKDKMNVVRRTCGYLGGNYWNEGKTKEIKLRVLHI